MNNFNIGDRVMMKGISISRFPPIGEVTKIENNLIFVVFKDGIIWGYKPEKLEYITP